MIFCTNAFRVNLPVIKLRKISQHVSLCFGHYGKYGGYFGYILKYGEKLKTSFVMRQVFEIS